MLHQNRTLYHQKQWANTTCRLECDSHILHEEVTRNPSANQSPEETCQEWVQHKAEKKKKRKYKNQSSKSGKPDHLVLYNDRTKTERRKTWKTKLDPEKDQSNIILD